MSEALGNLLERRSIRAYKPEQISEDELQSVLKAGLLAPSAMNRQPTAMLVVQDKDTIALLSKLNAKVMGKDIDPFYGAPTVIVVLADRNVPTYIEDGALVLGNLMNAANAIGLGSCWVNRAKEVFEMPEAREILRKAGIGDEYIGIGHCLLGYVALERNDQLHLELFLAIDSMGNVLGHDQGFAGVEQEHFAAYGELSGTLQHRYHSVAAGSVCGDLLALIKGENGHAHLVVLYQCFADNLTGLVLHQIFQL